MNTCTEIFAARKAPVARIATRVTRASTMQSGINRMHNSLPYALGQSALVKGDPLT